MDEWSCGAQALAVLAGLLANELDLAAVRERLPAHAEGASLQELAAAGVGLGLPLHIAHAGPDEPLPREPIILHFHALDGRGAGHFAAACPSKSGDWQILDPQRGSTHAEGALAGETRWSGWYLRPLRRTFVPWRWVGIAAAGAVLGWCGALLRWRRH